MRNRLFFLFQQYRKRYKPHTTAWRWGKIGGSWVTCRHNLGADVQASAPKLCLCFVGIQIVIRSAIKQGLRGAGRILIAAAQCVGVCFERDAWVCVPHA